MVSNTNQVLGRNEIYSSMNQGRPYASYIKTILGKVDVILWDNFNEAPMEILLTGNPKKREDTSIVDVWSEKEDVFFRRVNSRLFSKGVLIPYTRPEAPAVVERPIEQSTDEELSAIVNSKFLALQNHLNKIESIPVLFRIRGIAEELEKSAKIINAIEARISEIQTAELSPKRELEEE